MRTRPFYWIAEDAQRHVLVVLTILVAGCTAWMLWMGLALVTPAAQLGIVSFELALSLERTEAILCSWSSQAHSIAMLMQGVDTLYLLLYPAWFSLATDRLGELLGGTWRRAGSLVTWAILSAAPLDALENFALVHQLLHGADAFHAKMAWYCAVPKFILIAAAATFLVLAGGAWLTRVWRSGRKV